MGGGHYDLALVDLQMPGMDGFSLAEKLEKMRPEMPVVIITGHPDLEIAVRALRLGAADFLTKPVKLAKLDAVLEKSVRLSGLRRDKRRLRGAIRGMQAPSRAGAAQGVLVGNSPAMQEVRRQIREVVEAACETILITGETGTGKEVVAREIHFQAATPEDPFIAVSCPAMPDSLVDSELFGHVKGAFTGATEDRVGYFEMADGSTILLDEAGDLSLASLAARRQKVGVVVAKLDKGGTDILRAVHERYPQVAFLLITDAFGSFPAAEAASYGVFAYLREPIQLCELELSLARLEECNSLARLCESKLVSLPSASPA